MFGEEKNLKDTSVHPLKDTSNLPVSFSFEDNSLSVQIGSYKKTNKLISALYLVTDILSKEEPIRLKLRSLGAELLSDTYFISTLYRTGVLPKTSILVGLESKLAEIISFLEIASSVDLISPMNGGILKREFLLLRDSLKEYTDPKTTWLKEFLAERNEEPKREIEAKRQISETSVQKNSPAKRTEKKDIKDNFEDLKRQRRGEIIKIIKGNREGSTITDIRSQAVGVLASCGEKTLQRELISMVADGVLKKEGEKRWSRYLAL